MIVYLFGVVFFLVCLNFVVCKIVEDNVKDFFVDVLSIVWWNFYVDDCLKFLFLVEDVVCYVGELCSLL